MNELLKPGDEIRKRLQNLRTEMQKQAIDVLIIPGSDPHLSEYLPNYWRSRAWFSGFTGSAGTLVVGKDQASLWTDGRYWVQAEQELNHTDIVLCRINPSGQKDRLFRRRQFMNILRNLPGCPGLKR